MHRSATEIEEYACPVCETFAISDARYFARAFGEPRLVAATGGTVADALGFCPRHGAIFLSEKHLLSGIVHVLEDAIPRLTLLLNEDYFRESSVQQMLFAAGSACPACAYASRAARRHAGCLARRFSGAVDQPGFKQLDTFCVGHFQTLAAHLPPEPRLAALTRYADNLDRMARAMRDLVRMGREMDAWPLGNAAATMNRALGLVAGRPAFGPLSEDKGLADTPGIRLPMVEAISLREACPLCIEAERARQRWLQNVQIATNFDQDAWLTFPTCAEHIWTVARLGGPKLTVAVVSRAMSLALRHFRQQIQALVRAAEVKEREARIEAGGPDVSAAYKRSQTRDKSAREKAPTPRLAKCPGCERIDVAADRATGSLLDLLQQEKYRNAFNQGYGLCMKHFARVYLMAPKGMVRSVLAQGQQGRLAELAGNLGVPSRDLPKNETTALREISWSVALRRFSSGLA